MPCALASPQTAFQGSFRTGRMPSRFLLMVVINPSDGVEAKAAVEAAYNYYGPVYMRFGRAACPVINDTPDYKFEIGKGITLREGKDVAIIATGIEVAYALEAAELLAADGIEATVVNMHTIKPLDKPGRKRCPEKFIDQTFHLIGRKDLT